MCQPELLDILFTAAKDTTSIVRKLAHGAILLASLPPPSYQTAPLILPNCPSHNVLSLALPCRPVLHGLSTPNIHGPLLCL